MVEPKIQIDVKEMEVSERPKKVSRELDKIEKGDQAEIVADDERLPKLAENMLKSIGKSKLIKTWEGDDGYYHALTEKT